MKLLVDTCVSPAAVARLRASGHDTLYAGEWSPDPGDVAILQRAFSEKRVLITLDKDFGELIFAQGMSHAGVVRLVDLSLVQQGEIAQHIIERYQSELEQAAIITADSRQVRIRLTKTDED